MHFPEILYSESSPSLACTGKKIETQTCVVNSALTDFKNHDSGRRTTLSSKTKVNFACKCFAYYDDFDLKKKIVLLSHLIFLLSLLMVSSSSDEIDVMLEIAPLLSTSPLVALEGLEKIMATAYFGCS